MDFLPLHQFTGVGHRFALLHSDRIFGHSVAYIHSFILGPAVRAVNFIESSRRASIAGLIEYIVDSQYPFILNGKKPGKKEVKQFLNAISSLPALRSSGGFLFRFCLWEDALHLGIVPAISEGERLHHYDIKVPGEENVIGSISAMGGFTLLFKAEKEDLDDDIREKWRNEFKLFASVLISLGYSGKGQLDWITKQIIEESGIFDPVPETLYETAAGV